MVLRLHGDTLEIVDRAADGETILGNVRIGRLERLGYRCVGIAPGEARVPLNDPPEIELSPGRFEVPQ